MRIYGEKNITEKVREMVIEGYGHEVIAYHLQLPLRRVIEIVREFPFSPPLHPKFLPIEEEAVLELFRKGKDIQSIAKLFKRTPDAIDSFLRRKKVL